MNRSASPCSRPLTNHPPSPRYGAAGQSLITCCALIFSAAALFGQGSLTPPGAPAPTMKTLDEVEPRTNLQATPAPAGVDTTNANYHFIITQPGSYYLSANLTVSKPNGIQINAEGVTLDLNGFQISRASASGNGIEIATTSHRASIGNGSIKGFAYGINSLFSGTYPRGCTFHGLAVSGCTNTGILAGNSAVLESCRAHDNSGSYNIFAGSGSTLSNCTASNNTTTYNIYVGGGSSLANCAAYNNTATLGIYAGPGSSLTTCSAYSNTVQYAISADVGSSLTNCSAVANTSAVTFSAGIRATNGSTVTSCTARANTSTAASLTPNTGMGFNIATTSTIQNCNATNNTGDGINVPSNCVVRENNCQGNGFGSGDGAGIHCTNPGNRIEGNSVTSNTRGIDVDNTGSLIIKNSASGNTVNYDIFPSNAVGVIVATPASGAILGSTGGAGVGSTDPWANFSF
jgi:parallel beta-helix repeat protein